jgi:predicted ATPase
MQKVLKIASLIGFSFSTSILINISSLELLDTKQLHSEQPLSSYNDLVQSVLSRASSEGFIQMIGDDYQFSHDKLQDAFQSMVDHADKQRLHYLIGDQYVVHGRTDNDESIFQAAVHLNKSGDYALGKECREKLARINLAAAKRCRDKSAFIDAVVFLRHGLKVLDEAADDMWTKCFDLAFELTENLSKMELIVGNLDTCKQINEELVLRSKSTEMKIIPLVLDVEVRMAGNEMSETITAAKRALRELSIAVPDRVHIPKFMLKLRKVRRMIRGKDDEYILGLPSFKILPRPPK